MQDSGNSLFAHSSAFVIASSVPRHWEGRSAGSAKEVLIKEIKGLVDVTAVFGCPGKVQELPV